MYVHIYRWVPHEEPGGRGPSLNNYPNFWKNWVFFFRGGPVPAGSWFGTHQAKKPPQGGGGVLIKMQPQK